MSVESWRLSRSELRDVLNKYEKAVEDDVYGLLRPSTAERAMFGRDALARRAAAVRKARDANRRLVEVVLEDLPDLCAGPDEELHPARPLCEMRDLGERVPTLPVSSYGSMASVFLHLMRDWSTVCSHVLESTYEPALQQLKAVLPQGGEVLVPGAGLGRLALHLASAGYKVEANDASRLFLTFADFTLNRGPPDGLTLFPLAHVFSENWGLEQQYMEVLVPRPQPATIAAENLGKPILTMVAGDFVKAYGRSGPAHRRFDAIVTSFFIDTATDPVELFTVMDNLLADGGVWVNVGPLNWRKEARMKLCWDEIVAMWQGLGYDFVSQERVECDYHLPRGQKMYTESYTCALTAAVKRKEKTQ